MESNFTVEIRETASGAVVELSGELDVASSHVLERSLAKLRDKPAVVVDLRGLEFIDSTGLGVLVRAHQLAKEQGTRFGLAGPSGQVNRLLGLTGLDGELLVGDSPEQLLAD